MRPKDQERAAILSERLSEFDANMRPLIGIKDKRAREVLVEQIVESLRRIEYVHFIRDDKIDLKRADPNSELFDPLRAAVLKMRAGEVDEAFWLVFLSVHFGKHAKHGWMLVRNVYGALGGQPWTWKRVSGDVGGFRQWLAKNESSLRKYGFGNHRKYQSLSATSKVGTGAVISSYIDWIAPPRTHSQLIRDIHAEVGQNPREVFRALYKAMDAVVGFGRLGRFDFLTMLGKIGLAPIDPDSAYLQGATGPLSGARLLFSGDAKAKVGARELDEMLIELDASLNVGMQVLEDSLCNWQKSPRKFISFRG